MTNDIGRRTVRLSLDNYERKDDANSEIDLSCIVQGSEGEPHPNVRVRLKYQSGSVQDTEIAEGRTDSQGELHFEKIPLNRRVGFRVRILAVLGDDSDQAHQAAVLELGPEQEVKSLVHEIYGFDPDRESLSLSTTTHDVRRSEERESSGYDSVAEVATQAIEKGTEAVGEILEKFSFSLPAIPLPTGIRERIGVPDFSKLKFQLPRSPLAYLRNILPARWVFLPMLVAASSGTAIGGAYAALHGRSKGIDLAEGVVSRMEVLPSIPVYSSLDKNRLSPMMHLTSGRFLPEEIKLRDPLSRPIFPHEIAGEDAPLHLLREALKYKEDSQVDWNLGINTRTPYTILQGLMMRKKQGGSSIPNQLCGTVWDHYGDRDTETSGTMIERTKKIISDEIEETLCAIGLGRLGINRDPDENMADYMTTVYLGNGMFGFRMFMDYYWDIRDLNDPELNDGRQIIMAVLPRNRLDGGRKNPDGSRDPYTQETHDRQRGVISIAAIDLLERLLRKGVVEPAEKGRILKQIEEGLPEYRNAPASGKDSSWTFLNKALVVEVKNVLRQNNLNQENWRRSVDGLYVGIDFELQNAIADELTVGIGGIGVPELRGTTFVVNSKGEYIAMVTGDGNGFDNLKSTYVFRRTSSEKERPGSTGKLFIGVAAAAKGLTPPDDPCGSDRETESGDIACDIAMSSPHLITSAQNGDLSAALVSDLIDCYGERFLPDPIAAAVFGGWKVRPVEVSRMLHSILTGEALPEPHLLSGWHLRDGSDLLVSANLPPNTEGIDHNACAQSMYQNRHAKDWATLPFLAEDGTMKSIERPPSVEFIIGKTGTANQVDSRHMPIEKTTNIVWASYGLDFGNNDVWTHVTYIRPEKRVIREGLEFQYIDNTFDISNGDRRYRTSITTVVPIVDRMVPLVAERHKAIARQEVLDIQ